MELKGYYNNPNIVARWSLRTSTAPASEPVTTAEVKSNSHIDGSDEDTLIGELITAAREYCETYMRRALINRTYILYLDAVPKTGFLELPMPDLVSVTSIKYYDTDDALQTFSSASYRVDTFSHVGRITLKESAAWPTVIEDRTDAFYVTYVTGYGTATTDIPQGVRQAIMLLVDYWYENRGAMGAMSKEIMGSVHALLNNYKVPTL